MTRTPGTDPHLLAGPYALNALSAGERRRFERHLGRCGECAREVRGFAEVAGVLADATVRTPPDGLRDRVLRAVSQTGSQTGSETGAKTGSETGGARRWRTRFGYTLAGCLALILALTGGLVWQGRSMQEMSHREREIAAVLAAEDATYNSGRFDGATIGAVASAEHGAVVLTARGLTRAAGRAYQVWLSEPDGSMRSGGMLSVDEQGMDMMMVSDIGDAEEIAITMEPEGGSSRPTSKPMLSVPVR